MASGKAPSWVCASLSITDTKVAASDANTARNDRQRTLASGGLEYIKDAALHTSGFQEVWHLILTDPEGLPLPGLVYSWRQQISCPEGTFFICKLTNLESSPNRLLHLAVTPWASVHLP